MRIEIREAEPVDAGAVSDLLVGLGYPADIAAASGSTLMQVNCGRRPERERAHGFYVSLGYRDQHDHHVLYDKALSPPLPPVYGAGHDHA